MSKNLIHSRTCVYNINYHVVWSVKYRKPVLTCQMEQMLLPELQQIAIENNFTIDKLSFGDNDHVHCFVSAPPKIDVSTIVKILKGCSARILFKNFPDINSKLRKGVLWNHSYYVETIGSVSEDAIRMYIEKQTNSY